MDVLAFTLGGAAAAAYLRSRQSSARASSDPSTAPTTEEAARRLLAAHPRLGLACRPLFPTDFSKTHLNHGSYGVAPHAVMRAARSVMLGIEAFPDDFMRRNALRRFKEAAEPVARMVGAEPGSVVFVENATAGVNAVLNSLSLGRGDAILINTHTYNACKNAALRVAEKCGAEVLVQKVDLPVKDDDGIVAEFEAFLDAHKNVRFALVDHITSPTAVVMPVQRLCAAARARGVKIMVDGAHAPGQLPLDLAAMGCDWYTGNLHKWVFALKGTALLYASPSNQDETQSLIISHFWKKGFADRFFMQGTNDQSRYLSAADGVAFVGRELGGFAAMQRYNTDLVRLGARILCDAWGTAPMNPLGMTAPFLVPVEVPINWRAWVRRPAPAGSPAGAEGPNALGLGEEEAEAALAADEGFNERLANAVFFAQGIQSVFYPWRVGGRTRLWCRISAQVYNTPEDYRRLARAVLDLKAKTPL
jgi:isopenicillin-N epimerase